MEGVLEEFETDPHASSPASGDNLLPAASEAQTALVRRVHTNLGHPATDQFLRVLRAAKALPEVTRYVRDEFRCAGCDSNSRPRARRRAAMPRTYQFNRIVGADTFKVTLAGVIHNFLNSVCHGTNYQMIIPVGSDGLT